MKQDLRTCKGCGSDFVRLTRGGQKYCVPACRKKAAQLADREIIAKWQRSNPESRMLSAARSRAKKRGITCTITLEDITIPECCPVLGIPLQKHYGVQGGRHDSPALDRITPALGYVPGNVQVLSSLANIMKSDATPEHLLKFATWVQEVYGVK